MVTLMFLLKTVYIGISSGYVLFMFVAILSLKRALKSNREKTVKDLSIKLNKGPFIFVQLADVIWIATGVILLGWSGALLWVCMTVSAFLFYLSCARAIHSAQIQQSDFVEF